MSDNQETHGSVDNAVLNELLAASDATRKLAGEGITVLCAIANGRRPLLIVDAMPKGLPTVIKTRTPSAFGYSVVEAGEFNGCQLEWIHDIHTRTRPQLEVVRG